MPDVGHNGPPIASDQLRSIIERVETLEDEKAVAAEYIKEVYAEAKGNGFDTKSLRKLVSLRKKDRTKLLEDKAMLELYAAAMGCLDLV
tara:strand:+ start:713 stop:979 length:267 start_codon:yes stop_codon:yes gene_type:complete